MPTLVVVSWTPTNPHVYFSQPVVVSVCPTVLAIPWKSCQYSFYLLDHAPGTSSSALLTVPSRQPTPLVEGKGLNSSLNGTGTSTPTSVKPDSTIYFDCQYCQRQACPPIGFYASDDSLFRTMFRLPQIDMPRT